MKETDVERRQVFGRWRDNTVENSHQPFRRREGVIARSRDIETLQKLASSHGWIHNYFNFDRHLTRRSVFKQNPSTALAEWLLLAA